MEHTPTVIPIEPNELVDFCSDHGYSYRVEAIGSLLIPPNYYVGITDWERALRLRCDPSPLAHVSLAAVYAPFPCKV